MLATWPAARPALAFFQLFLGPANAAFSGHLLLGILDPADEFVAGQRGYVLPGIESCGVGNQCLAQVRGKLVHHPTGYSRATHRTTVQRLVSARSDFWRKRLPAIPHRPLGWLHGVDDDSARVQDVVDLG